jgi:hypothetical protein
MILNVKKIHAIKFQWFVTVPLDNTKSTMCHYEKFWMNFFCYSNIDRDHPLWTFILNDLKLWHVAQSKFATLYINYILKKMIIYLPM